MGHSQMALAHSPPPASALFKVWGCVPFGLHLWGENHLSVWTLRVAGSQ